MAAAALPWFRDLTGIDLQMPWSSPLFWTTLAGGSALVGVLAGSYPAFFLSAFDSIRVLKGQVTGMGRGQSLRSALVVFQFAISVALIISTLLVFKQLNYIQHKKLGFNKEQVVILDDAYALGDKIYTLKEEMLKQPGVESGTVSGFLPVSSNRSDYTFSKIRGFDKDNTVSMQQWEVDNDYLKTMGMEIVQGRAFDPARMTDSTGLILNETAARLFGFDDPIGQKVYVPEGNLQGAPKPEDFTELHIIGVVRDFHWSSLREHIGALSFKLGKSQSLVSFRYQGAETAPLIAALEKNWKALSPDQPFSYRFLDESFARMYKTEQRIGKIAGIFGLLSILISCLGLFGLAAFTTEQRTKEIGIRKVLGASVTSVVGLLSRDFLKLILVALLIASPVAYYFMKLWLSDFAYSINISWWIFAAAGSIAVVVAFVTVGYQSLKAALANPVKSLRSE
jgi:putative ABC transport system permease protein